MSTNQTPNYALSQWEAGDQVLRADFNADNAKIDAALAELQASQLRIHTGHYIGSGEEEKTIELPFTPKFMWLERYPNQRIRIMLTDHGWFRIKQLDGEPRASGNGEGVILTQDGSTIHLRAITGLPGGQGPVNAMNEKNIHYLYVAFG